jgi:hypothetical protein
MPVYKCMIRIINRPMLTGNNYWPNAIWPKNWCYKIYWSGSPKLGEWFEAELTPNIPEKAPELNKVFLMGEGWHITVEGFRILH